MMVNTTVGPDFFSEREEESRNLHNRPSGKTLEPITGLMDLKNGRVIAINVEFFAGLSDTLVLHFFSLIHRAEPHDERQTILHSHSSKPTFAKPSAASVYKRQILSFTCLLVQQTLAVSQ